MKTFTLSYDPFDTKISAAQVHEIVRNNRHVVQWYFPFIGTCIFKSDQTLIDLAPSFRAMFNGAPFLLSETFPHLTGGAQDSHVWDWLNSNQLPNLLSPN